jgi:hypothetical protein
MGKTSKTDLAQRALNVVSMKDGPHYEFRDLTPRDIAISSGGRSTRRMAARRIRVIGAEPHRLEH